ncbi:MAG TPA: [FeFe] hydrogenase, group A [Myxococcales bacterium]
MNETATLTIDGRPVPIEGERNLLELVRKAGVDLPTFCYHSELSVYGACRLCLVEVEGRGVQGACSTPPEPGLKLRTNTEQIREIRKIAVELLLANHDQQCPTCPKSGACQLQGLARRLGIEKVRFKPLLKPVEVDRSSPSILRDPNRCVLCGDCVRACAEIQGVGAIDFAFRGAESAVMPSFAKTLGEVECVNCGQCAVVCPTGALTPRSEVDGVWAALADPKKKVVAQIAPAVRVALGESFGMAPGEASAGQAVAALKAMGFAQVYDTAFSADLTVIEEATEFLRRAEKGERLPQFTSCCPAWVKFAEQYHPKLLPNLSTCRSPQQMLGSLAKRVLPGKLGVKAEDVVMVSVMPCTAKKFEAQRPEFRENGLADVDHVITTGELARMIEAAGLRFRELAPESFDLPMGFKTGAGVIFGSSGGVTEAVLRYAAEKLVAAGVPACTPIPVDFHEVRGEQGLREARVQVGGLQLKLAVVHGLANARSVAERVAAGKADWDLIEVMACPGGCIGGAGQPLARDGRAARRGRASGLYAADKNLELHRAQENPFVAQCYQESLGEVGGPRAHQLLHTHYQSRRRLPGEDLQLMSAARPAADRVAVKVCVGTGCYVKGSQPLLTELLRGVRDQGLESRVDVRATFCMERCGEGPNVEVAGQPLAGAKLEATRELLQRTLSQPQFTGAQVAVDLATAQKS